MPMNQLMDKPATSSNRKELREQAASLLPEQAAGHADYEQSLDGILDASRPTALLLAVLAELWRRLGAAEGDVDRDILEASAAKVEDALTERRMTSRLADRERQEQAVPLRRRLLLALNASPSTPTVLSRNVGATKEAVSRSLSKLEDEGLVSTDPDPDDRRRRLYTLTYGGAVARRDQMAEPTEDVGEYVAAATVSFLDGALEEAVNLRRHAHNLDGVVERLRRIKEEAREVGAPALELRARRELTTTLRQAAHARPFFAEVKALTRIAAGADPSFDSRFAMAAYGHAACELGRYRGQVTEEFLAKNIRHLMAAADIFAGLADSDLPVDNWQARQAWAFFGLADTHRLRTDFWSALSAAVRSLRLFKLIDDAYGVTSCLVLAGRCLLLRGQFAESLAVLQRAREGAERHRFSRLEPVAWMQLGEAHRCSGQLDDAHSLLTQAVARTGELNIDTMSAFAQSSLGATEYDMEHYDLATSCFAAAGSLFKRCGHAAGLALNLRREAVLQRRLLAESPAPADETRALLRSVQRRYSKLGSPAGVVACLIEEGQLALDAGISVPNSLCRRLAHEMNPIQHRELVEKDPWVPAMLAPFAQAVGHNQLIELSGGVGTRAAERQSDRQKEWDSLHAAFDVPVAAAIVHRTQPDCMAGEARRLIGPVASNL
jgi:tetratricopeptide (TPR) repeat protein/DNA-binding transcriptional ArsR family regulator